MKLHHSLLRTGYWSSLALVAALIVLLSPALAGGVGKVPGESPKSEGIAPTPRDTLGFEPAAGLTLNEDNVPAIVSVVRKGAATNTAAVHVVSLNGTARSGADFPDVDVWLSFPPGIMSQTISVRAFPDMLTEGLEKFTLEMIQSIEADFSNPSITISIQDTSTTPVPSDAFRFFPSGSITVGEGNPPLMVQVMRDGPALSSASVDVQFNPGSAQAGVDYIPGAYHLLFPPGVTTQHFEVSAIADFHTEGPEAFTITLQNAVGATVADGLLLVNIDDLSLDPPPQRADLELQASLNRATGPVGEPVLLTVTVNNRGPDAAQGVSVSVPVPPTWQVEPPLLTLPQQFNPASGQWFVGQLLPGESRQLVLRLTPHQPGETKIPIEVSGSSLPDPDSVPANGNPAEDDFSLVLFKADDPMADLLLTKSAGVSQAGITKPVTFEIVVENLGPDDARDIVITDTIPAGLVIDSAVEPFDTTFAKDTGIWKLPKLDKGAKKTLKITVKTTTSGGDFTNRVVITSSLPKDPVDRNNKAEAPVTYIGYTACGIASVCNEGDALPNVNALVTLEKAPLKRTTRTDAFGAFCFSNLLAGDYKITIDPAVPASGILQVKDTITVSDAATQNTFEAKRRLIIGRVTFGAGGTGIPDVVVEATGGAKPLSTKTDAQGDYKFEGLEEVEYTVQPKAPAAGIYKPANFKVDFNRLIHPCPARANFVLEGKFSISGRLNACNAAGPVIPNATVTLLIDGETTGRTVRTGMDGRYAFTNLPPGKYVVTPTSPSFTYKPANAKHTLKDRGLAANFIGNPGNNIAGRILGHNKEALPGIEVQLFQFGQNAAAAKTTTDPAGEFRFPNLANGIWFVVPTPPEKSLVFYPPMSLAIQLGGINPSCLTYPQFFANRNAAELVALEVTQVIQDWQNSVPLVAGKATLIRAHLKPAGTNRTPVSIGNVRLVVERDGKVIDRLRPDTSPINARPDFAADAIRTDFKMNHSFVLNAAESRGTVTFRLEWTGGVLTTYLDPDGKQTAVRDNATTVKFEKVNPIQLRWVQITWLLDGKDHAAGKAHLQNQLTRLRAGLPVPTIAEPGAADLTTLSWTPPKGLDPAAALTEGDAEKLRASLQHALQRKLRDEILVGRDRTIYHGVLVDTTIGGQASEIGGTTSFGDMTADAEFARNLPTHELGHILRRHHDVHTAFGLKFVEGTPLKQGFCNEIAKATAPDYPMEVSSRGILTPTLGPMGAGPFKLAYGWDRSSRRVVSPFQTADIMSYCAWDTKWVWPGIPSYKGMYEAMRLRFGPRGSGVQLSEGTTIPALRISGMLNSTGQLLEFDPIRPVTLPTLPSAPQPGEFAVRLLDGVGLVLQETPFAPGELVQESHDGRPSAFQFFDLTTPFPANLATVELWHQAVLLHRLIISAHAPELFVTAPGGAVNMDQGPVKIVWHGSDADADVLRYTIEASANGGTTWDQIAADLTDTMFRLTPTLLPPGPSVRLRVRASDGFNETVAEVPATFRASNEAPAVALSAPVAGTVFSYGDLIRLQALATDREDGAVPEDRIHWSSTIQGDLGTGSDLDVAASRLTPGIHTLKVQVTDQNGAVSEDAVTVEVTVHHRYPMRIVGMTDEVEVWWPSESAALRLEASEQLDGEGWYPAGPEPVLDGAWFHVRLPVGGEPLYFRLVDPVTP